jgi:hypothetical protein
MSRFDEKLPIVLASKLSVCLTYCGMELITAIKKFIGETPQGKLSKNPNTAWHFVLCAPHRHYKTFFFVALVADK